MHSHNLYRFILAITAVVASRVMFAFFDDPEGPNLLIVAVLAGVLYGISLLAYRLSPLPATKLPYAIFIQVLLVTVLYSLGR
jgi:hypothetical protein